MSHRDALERGEAGVRVGVGGFVVLAGRLLSALGSFMVQEQPSARNENGGRVGEEGGFKVAEQGGYFVGGRWGEEDGRLIDAVVVREAERRRQLSSLGIIRRAACICRHDGGDALWIP